MFDILRLDIMVNTTLFKANSYYPTLFETGFFFGYSKINKIKIYNIFGNTFTLFIFLKQNVRAIFFLNKDSKEVTEVRGKFY